MPRPALSDFYRRVKTEFFTHIRKHTTGKIRTLTAVTELPVQAAGTDFADSSPEWLFHDKTARADTRRLPFADTAAYAAS